MNTMLLRKKPFLLLASAVLLSLVSGCTSSLRLNVLQPAQINVDSDIETLVLANRYRPAKGSGLWNVLEGVVTGEGIGQDRRGAETSLVGLTNSLAGSPRFNIKRASIELRGTGLGVFPDPLTQSEVMRLCEQHEGDALVTIEAFDSDGSVAYESRLRERKNRDGSRTKVPYFTATQSVRVTVGWRLYDPRDGALIDEYRMYETIRFDGEGWTRADAFRNLPSREYMVQRIGSVVGEKYAARISPTWVWVSRQYYSGGSPQLKAAKRYVRVNEWDRALELWEKDLEHSKRKIRGRAAYNIALANEVKGNLEWALKWAEKAYTEYGNKQALQYSRILKRRMSDEQLLDFQLEGDK